MKLSRYEQETIILYNQAEATAEVYTHDPRLLEKLRRKLDVKTTAHKLAGQAVQEGKVFYYPRVSVDKPHNKVNYAFMQQLPSDWTKIVGFNSVSKYTVALRSGESARITERGGISQRFQYHAVVVT